MKLTCSKDEDNHTKKAVGFYNFFAKSDRLYSRLNTLRIISIHARLGYPLYRYE